MGVLILGRAECSNSELSFLSAVSGIGALAVASGEAVTSQQRLVGELEQAARAAHQEAEAKAQLLDELDQKLALIEKQNREIRVLSTPILELWESVLAMPIIGTIDEERSRGIMERLLEGIVAKQARYVVLDFTGVDKVDARTAHHFVKVIRAAQFLGARGIVTGIRPAVAKTIVQLGVNLSSMATLRNMQEGLKHCTGFVAEVKRSQAI